MKKYVKPTTPKKAQTSQPGKDGCKISKRILSKEEKSQAQKQRIFKSQNVVPKKGVTLKEQFIKRNDTPKERKHPEYGTSNLEKTFAKKFLDKLGIKYEYQFKAESIGRYFDFRVIPDGPILEVNGTYWHSDERIYEGKELTPTQKKNKRVDKAKKKWADEHKIPIYYFWEKDINENPDKVINDLKNMLAAAEKQQQLKLLNNTRHNFKK